MKKGWKIALISLGSLLGLIIIVVVVACWLIFTPARLTSIVNKLSDKYILCENHFGNVDLTLFKTFPNVGLEVHDVVLINPYDKPDSGIAQGMILSDTLASVGTLTVGIDVKEFLSNKNIVVRQVCLDDAQANLYTSLEGWSNLDIFPKSEKDTTESETKLPDTIQIEKVKINNLSARYCNLQQSLQAAAENLNLTLKGDMVNKDIDADLSLEVAKLLVDMHDNMHVAAQDLDLSAKGDWTDSKADAKLSLDMAHLLFGMNDSLGRSTLTADVDKVDLALKGQGPKNNMEGNLELTLPKGNVTLGGKAYTTQAMNNSRHDLLAMQLPFHADLDDKSLSLADAVVSLLEYAINLDGSVSLPNEGRPMHVDMAYRTDRWQVADLIAVLPPFITKSLKGMNVDGKLSLDGKAVGDVAEGQLPLVNADVLFEKGTFSAPKMLPMPVKKIGAKMTANLNLSSDAAHKGPSKVKIDYLNARAENTDLSVSGTVDDLLGKDMLVDAVVKGDINLPDLKAFLPDTMPIALQGTTKADIKVKSRLSAITKLDLAKVHADGTLKFADLDVTYDSIHAQSRQLDMAVKLPANPSNKNVKELIGAHIQGGKLDVQMVNKNLTASVADPDIKVGLPNILDKNQPLAAAFDVSFSKVNADMDSMTVYSDTLKLKGSVRNDKSQDNPLKQWHPDVDIDLHRAVLAMDNMSEAVRMPSFRFNYKPEVCEIADADIRWGVSDYHLSGKVYGVEDWLSHKAMLRGDVYFSSQYADIDQLLGILSGMGSDKDTLALQRQEDNVPKEANPFIVPKDVNVTLHTNIDRCIAFENDLNQLGGTVTVNDGVAVLDQIGFTCKAARMQLTAIYKSPRVNHLFAGIDFHLLDITVEELIDMVPSVDTLVPMLKAFKGRADFHLAAECNLDAFYKPKMSTLLGAAAITGKDLVVLDNETISDIAKLLQFKNWREHDNNIGVDSISVEATVFRKEIVVYPFLLNLHNYQLCVGGRHTLDNACNYHLELIKCPLPVRLAVDVNGSLSKPKIGLGKVQYAELYKPEKRDEVQTRTLELKKMIRQALESNVKVGSIN